VSGVAGADRLRKDAVVFRDLLVKKINDQVEESVDSPVAKFRGAVDASIGAKFPTGYSGTFDSAWNILVTKARGAGLRIRLRGTAHGRSKIRDSAALNRGVLRHKTWGRLPWHSQAIPPRFWDEPADELVDEVRNSLEEAVAKAAKEIEASL